MDHANTEIERKYLTRSEAWRSGATGQRIVQGYLTSHGGPAVVRVRVAGEDAFLTIKGRQQRTVGDRRHGGDALQHAEYEYPIPTAHAEAMLAQMARRPLIEKTRYRVAHAHHRWEVDEFGGANAGLVVAEVELARADQRPELPEWVGEEVTADSRYTNSALSELPYASWQSDGPLLIDRALAYAVRAHQGHTRKGTAIPYVTHPICVAATLINAGCDAVVAVAGYLHDTVEDTATTYGDLRGAFGAEVADLVAVASEPDKAGPWEERKRHTLEALPRLARRQLWVPLADKIDNAESIERDLDAAGEGAAEIVWGRFNRPIDQQEWYYRSLLAAFQDAARAQPVAESDPGFSQLVRRLASAVERLFGTPTADNGDNGDNGA